MSVAASAIIHTLAGDLHASAVAARAEPFFGFTWDGKQISVGQARLESCGVQPVLRVVLDNGRSVGLTAAQLVIAKETAEPVSFATVGLSVMPLYLGSTTLGYPTFRQQGDLWRNAAAPSDRRRDRLVARMVWEWKSKERIETGMIVRHCDKDRLNCVPDNLRLEGKPQKGRIRGTLKTLIEAQRVIARGATGPGRNHKIVGWEAWEEEETFDLTSAQCSNLAVGEVFVAVNHVPA